MSTDLLYAQSVVAATLVCSLLLIPMKDAELMYSYAALATVSTGSIS